MTDARLEQLRTAAEKATTAHSCVMYESLAKHAEMVKAAKAKIEDEIADEFGARLKKLAEAKNAAWAALQDHKEAQAKAGVGAPYPLGTVMVEWEFDRWGWEFIKSGKVGIVEAVTANSVYADNKIQPSIGGFAIRINKKDGKPGLSFVDLCGWRSSYWHPEGVNPNAKEAVA